GYHYYRPAHYGNTNIYINNNNYYNRFNNNNNLNPSYKPKPVPYNTNKNSVYAKSMGNTPGGNKGVNYRPSTNNTANNLKGQTTYQGNRPANNANGNARPSTGDVQNRPSGANVGTNTNSSQRPAGGNAGNTTNNANNWKGQTTYQGNKAGNTATNVQGRAPAVPGNANASVNNRAATGNVPARNPSGDRGYGQAGGTRPTTGNTQASRPPSGNTAASRPAPTTQPAARPAPQQANRPQSSSNGGAFGGVSNPKSDRAASNRGQASMGAKSRPNGGASQKR
ncbi:MAG: hypothetical protein WBR26_21330, partial [Candidatus Acidiferrum sp.]